jgi:hypothetical protein
VDADAVVRRDGGGVATGISGDTFGSLCMGADGAGSGGWASVSANGSLRGASGVLGSATCGAIYGGMSIVVRLEHVRVEAEVPEGTTYVEVEEPTQTACHTEGPEGYPWAPASSNLT